MSKLQNEKKILKDKKGITLIGLVVTIIVLLILAGVSIMTLTGDNGLLTRTVGAKNKTKIAEAQEIANLEYEARLIDSRVNTTSASATAESIADVLDKKGFTVQDKGATISGVSLLDGTTPVTTLNLNTRDEKTLKVSTETTGNGNTEWYVQIDDKWHKIEVKSNGVEIAKEGIASLGNSNATQKIIISVTGMPDNSTASVKKVVTGGEDITILSNEEGIEVAKNDEIKITAGSSSLEGVKITLSVANVNDPYNVELKVTKVIKPTDEQIATVKASPVVPDETFKRDYGLIDVIWIDKTNNIISSPLVEIPTKQVEENGKQVTKNLLTPIELNSDGTYTENPTGTWYDYAEKTTTTTSQWANAINPDDKSFFVWIPRYAYIITYYDKNPKTDSTAKITGYYDGNGMWSIDANENITAYYALEDGIETVNNAENGKKYIVHPAFMKDTGKKMADGVTALPDYDRGGWIENLAGIWVAKYEMSRENYNSKTKEWEAGGAGDYGRGDVEITNDNRDTVRTVSKPSPINTTGKGSVASWVKISIGNSYKNAYNYNRELESHLMKNSEWGAVAYLTYSQFGTDGEEVAINNNKNCLTGCSGGNSYVESSSTYKPSYVYNDVERGVKASSTGNITGIYDLSGGASESVAAYNSKEDSTNRYITKNGWGIDLTKGSTQYATKYNNNSDPEVYNGAEIYNVGKIGDATKEVYSAILTENDGTTVASLRNWFQDTSNFFTSDFPFVYRGGAYNQKKATGIFNELRQTGGIYDRNSFRVVLAPSSTNSNF